MLGAQQRNRWWNNLCHNATLANQKPEVINGKGTKTTMAPHKGKSYVWTDTEVELLLSVTLEYEVNKIQENEDWESSQSKYSSILALFLEQYRSETPLEKKKKKVDEPKKKSFPVYTLTLKTAYLNIFTLAEVIQKLHFHWPEMPFMYVQNYKKHRSNCRVHVYQRKNAPCH